MESDRQNNGKRVIPPFPGGMTREISKQWTFAEGILSGKVPFIPHNKKVHHFVLTYACQSVMIHFVLTKLYFNRDSRVQFLTYINTMGWIDELFLALSLYE